MDILTLTDNKPELIHSLNTDNVSLDPQLVLASEPVPDQSTHMNKLHTTNGSPQADDASKALLIMNINIGDGEKYSLSVMEGDDPFDLAKAFCKKHSLNENVIDALAQNIYDNMELVLQETVNTIQQSYIQSAPSHLLDSPLTKRHREFLEPEHREDNLDRCYETEEAEPFEQIEKNFSEEPNDNSGTHAQRVAAQIANYREEIYNQTDKSNNLPQESFGRMLDSIPADGSMINTTIKLGELLAEENKLYTECVLGDISTKKDYINSQLDMEEVEQSFDVNERDLDKSDANINSMEKSSEKKPKRKSLTNRRADLRSDTEFKINSRSCERTVDEGNPKRGLNITSYADSSESPQKAKRKIRQKSSECLIRKSTTSLHEDMKKSLNKLDLIINLALTPKKKNSQLDTTETFGTPEVVVKPAKTKRTKSAFKPRPSEEATFKPKINKVSEKIAEERDKQRSFLGSTPFQRLFNQHKVKEVKQDIRSQKIDEECTFKPSINNYSGTALERTSFEERNRKFQSRMNRTHDRQKSEAKEVFDPQTGKPLFHPATGRAPAQDRNQTKLPIGDYLYSHRQNVEGNRSAFKESKTHEIKLSEKSQSIIEKKYKSRLDEVFQELDSDQDGFISASSVDINPIEPFILEIIAPVLCSMEESDKVLNKESFISDTLQLVKSLSIIDRDRFLATNNISSSQNDSSEEFSFKPEINKKSNEIAKTKRPSGDFNTLYEKFMNEKKMKEDKIRKEQERRRELELQDCSFKPIISRKSARIVKK